MVEKIGRYEMRGLIGKGGMADVYRAYDPRFQRDVAVKMLPAEFLRDPQFRQRFEREAVIIARLQHPAIVPVFDFGDDDGRLYLVMRLMEGGSLRERLDGKPIPLADAARLMKRLAPALDGAHGENVVHRDLKPGNILFDRWDEPYLTDFGIVKLLEENETALTKTGGVLGTPAYMSPEQVKGEAVDGRTDIYALGVILYEMLTGTQPYQANTPISMAIKHLHEPIPRILEANSDLPPGMQPVIDRALAKDRADRYPSVQALAGELDALARMDKKAVSAGTAAALKPASGDPAAGIPLPQVVEKQIEKEEPGPEQGRVAQEAVAQEAVAQGAVKQIEQEADEGATVLDPPAEGVAAVTMIDTPPQSQQVLAEEKIEETDRKTAIPPQSQHPFAEEESKETGKKTAVPRWLWLAGVVVVLLLAGGLYAVWGGGGDGAAQTKTGPLTVGIEPRDAGQINEVGRLNKSGVITAAFAAEGRLLALLTARGVTFYDGLTLDELSLMPSEVLIDSMAITPDGQTVALGLDDNTIRLRRVATGSVLKTLKGHSGRVNSLAFAPDGETLVSGADDETVRLWRVDSGSLLKTLEAHAGRVNSVVFAPDGESVASGSDDETIRLWRVASGSLLMTLSGHTDEVTSVTFAPGGEILASGARDGTVRLWRAATGTLLKTRDAHAGDVHSVDFSVDGEILAAGLNDQTVRLWRVKSGSLLKTLAGHKGAVNAVDFSPDGESLASASDDGTVRLWGVIND